MADTMSSTVSPTGISQLFILKTRRIVQWKIPPVVYALSRILPTSIALTTQLHPTKIISTRTITWRLRPLLNLRPLPLLCQASPARTELQKEVATTVQKAQLKVSFSWIAELVHLAYSHWGRSKPIGSLLCQQHDIQLNWWLNMEPSAAASISTIPTTIEWTFAFVLLVGTL